MLQSFIPRIEIKKVFLRFSLKPEISNGEGGREAGVDGLYDTNNTVLLNTTTAAASSLGKT